MARPVAIVTGGSSGIGLAICKHLASLGWNVAIFDIAAPLEAIENSRYFDTDVTSWDQQAQSFENTYNWHGRLDLCVLNAGIDDRDNIFDTLSRSVEKPPVKPRTDTFSVNIIGSYYGIKLGAHYLTVSSDMARKPKAGGKIIVTASGAGLYPIAGLPQYTASKHAIVGLVRAFGSSEASAKANVSVNAICPGIVSTGLMPPALMANLPGDQLTPISTILRCLDTLVEPDLVDEDDWVRKGVTGEILEGSRENLKWHHLSAALPPAPDEGEFDRKNAISIVTRAFTEKTIRYTLDNERSNP